MSQFVLAITGPTGSGKSSVAARLAKQTDNCVNIDADHIKHFVVNPFDYEESGGIKQWELVGENIGLVAKNFIDNGYNVIINGYINEPAWNKVNDYIKFTHKVLLLPELEVASERDVQRHKDAVMGPDAVGVHHNYFSNDPFYSDFVKIDSTTLSVDETVKQVSELIHGN